MHEMELPEKLCAIARAGAGVNNIPLEKCADQGIVVFNTPGGKCKWRKGAGICRYAAGCPHNIGGANWVQSQDGNADVAAATEKEKKKFAGSELPGQKLGIIALGAIGVKVANTAIHLGMDVHGYDPYISADAAWNLSRDHHINDVDESLPSVRLHHDSRTAAGLDEEEDDQCGCGSEDEGSE